MEYITMNLQLVSDCVIIAVKAQESEMPWGMKILFFFFYWWRANFSFCRSISFILLVSFCLLYRKQLFWFDFLSQFMYLNFQLELSAFATVSRSGERIHHWVSYTIALIVSQHAAAVCIVLLVDKSKEKAQNIKINDAFRWWTFILIFIT